MIEGTKVCFTKQSIFEPDQVYLEEFLDTNNDDVCQFGTALVEVFHPRIKTPVDELRYFVIYRDQNDGKISALATVIDKGEDVYEIGMEVDRSSQGLGMGRAVVNSAVQWILGIGGTPLATVGPFNVPSTRTLRSVGLTYYMTDMFCEPGDFVIPPQALGTPTKNMDVYNLYPDWAMNNMIKSKRG